MKLPKQAEPVLRTSKGIFNQPGNITTSGGWCTCNDGSVDTNKCTGNTKPKCDFDDCTCVQK